MARRVPVYEGKAKILYEGPEPHTYIQHFKDDVTAFNAQKREVIPGKGILNNRISEFIMTKLSEASIPTHFIRSVNMREQLVWQLDMLPLEVVVRNTAAGTICKRLGFKEGETFIRPLLEFCLKNDELGDPLVSEEHIYCFGWADPVELEEIKGLALRANDFLRGLFFGIGLRLIDFKLEFGRLYNEDNTMMQILIADEITPDSCRLWDVKTGNKMDKDRFRLNLGQVAEHYEEIARRLGVLVENTRKPEEKIKPIKPTK